jgi:GDPmannose 4,6-dehydratase
VSQPKALITGITGQDGSYLAELLIDKGYEVHGFVRRVALEDHSHRLGRIASIVNRVTLHAGSMESFPSLYQVVRRVEPDECYHLAAQSFVAYSFDDAFSTLNVNLNGTHYMLESLRQNVPRCRFYFAGSSEMFGNAEEVPQTERTRFHPRSAYGISKVAGFDLTRNYREAYNMHASTGILFNHESERRGHEFVTRKITAGVAAIVAGKQKELRLGNLDAQRDWGYAPDYVEAMWRMLQQDKADDYVVASGEVHSVREFAQIAFSLVGLNYEEFVVIDPQLYRPAEIDLLIGNAEKFQKRTGWRPNASFRELIRSMVEADLLAAGVIAALQ